jgi:hypothetical protein
LDNGISAGNTPSADVFKKARIRDRSLRQQDVEVTVRNVKPSGQFQTLGMPRRHRR